MNYCALEDAFQAVGGAPSPGCGMDTATRAARKEERRKARRCKGPAAAYLDLEDKDPDRQTWSKAPEVPAMNPSIGMREHEPVTAPQGDAEPFSNPTAISSLPGKTAKASKSFFGASPDEDDLFADYVPDQSDYQLTPDFMKAFEHAGVARAGSSASLPNPSVNMFWKPLSTGGAQTSFIERLPPPGGKYPQRDPTMDEMMKKMDKIFARLDDMNNSSPEQITSELLMFISSGIFVLFLMDLLVKKGSRLRF
jgi:hypothetical protein